MRIKDALMRFVDRVERTLGSVEVYLIGSYARGDWLNDSDLDLIVVSERFEGLDRGERHVIVRELLPKDISVELLLYTPEEFERVKRRSIVVQDASEYWIKLL